MSVILQRRYGLGLAVVPLTIVLVAFFAYPIARICLLSFGDADGILGAYRRLVEVPIYRTSLVSTFGISALVTLLCVLLAYPVAYLMASVGPRLAALCGLCVLLPFWTSSLVRTTAWIILLQRYGIINSLLMRLGVIHAPISFTYNLSGVLIGMTHVLVAFVILPLYGAFRSIDRSVLRAAEGLGASPLRIGWRIVFPQTARAASCGATIVFMSALGYYITPALMGGARETMAAQLIAFNVEDQLDWSTAGALATVIVVAALAIFAVAQHLAGAEGLFGGRTSTSAAARAAPWPARSTGGRIMVGLGCLVLVFLVAPILTIGPMSLEGSSFLTFPPRHFTWRWYHEILTRSQWHMALTNSLAVGAIAVVGATLLGTLAAVGVSALRGRVRSGLEMLIIMPMVAPPIALAIGLYYELVPLHLLSGYWGLGIGHIVLAAPFVFISVRADLQRFDWTLVQAASSLGSGAGRIAIRILLPAIMPGVLGGAIFAFIASFDDVVLALFLTDVHSRTLPRLIFENVSQEINPTIAAVSTLISVATVAILSLNLLLARRDR